MSDFLAMGGYAQWVWSAFGLTLLVLVANLIAAAHRYRQAIERLRGQAERVTGSVRT